ncbi:MAG: aminodeoxychorismate synthase component I [Acidobacteriota bacterium]
MRAAEAEADAGAWVAGFLSYEAASGFDAALVTHPLHDLPLAWFAVFDRPSSILRAEGATAPPAPAPPWQPRISEADYQRGFAAVTAAIAGGDSYQANYTLRLDTTWPDDDVWARYTALVAAHRPPYAACLELDDVVVVSLSPELLLERRGRHVATAPMKGTARRGRWPEEDAERARELAGSAKDRAENVMIVDLARNDLGRVCAIGSIAVPSLFEVQRYRAAWQMVSTVTGTLREDVTLTDTIAALFPAGSITGAPKVSTMRLIRRIEPEPRGIYCGAIGLIAPGGNAIFNVAIRTAVFTRRSRQVSLGVGGGITWDSAPGAELAEARLKATFLDVPPAFSLLETMRFDGRALARWPRHLARLLASAAYFDLTVSPDRVTDAVTAHTAQWTGLARRVRLTVAQDGAPAVTSTALDALDARPWPRLVSLSAEPVSAEDPFLCHKSTHRRAYERRHTARPDVFDVLLVNDRGELTEFTIGNLVVELEGRLVTPPRSAGLLAGIFRGELLDQGVVTEQPLTVADLDRATRRWLVNSVREWVPVTFVP